MDNLKMVVNNESVSTCLNTAYASNMSATVRYRGMDSALQKKGVAVKDIYNFLVNQYKLEGIEVKKDTPSEHAIHLYQGHVSRFFQGNWKSKEQVKRVQGKVVRTKKGSDKPRIISEKAVKTLLNVEDNVVLIIAELESMGYSVSK